MSATKIKFFNDTHELT